MQLAKHTAVPPRRRRDGLQHPLIWRRFRHNKCLTSRRGHLVRHGGRVVCPHSDPQGRGAIGSALQRLTTIKRAPCPGQAILPRIFQAFRPTRSLRRACQDPPYWPPATPPRVVPALAARWDRQDSTAAADRRPVPAGNGMARRPLGQVEYASDAVIAAAWQLHGPSLPLLSWHD